MPHVCFVNPPNHLHDQHDLAPPLGLMILAEIALAAGWSCAITDLSLPRFIGDDPSFDEFYHSAVDQILSTTPDVVAMTSMAVNSHVSLLLAETIKTRSPRTTIVLGGPHFTSIHDAVMTQYPFVDLVIRGEAEHAWQQFLTNDHRCTSAAPSSLPEIRHPVRAYELIDLKEYFAANPRRLLNYEAGRGCVFKCAFCYSPSHYRGARDVTTATLENEWPLLVHHGAQQVFIVQDNFVNIPAHAIDLCETLANHRDALSWNGYATLPQLTRQVVDALGNAGCNAIYLGIDAISGTQKVAFNKRFYRTPEALARVLEHLVQVGIEPTCAFMLDLFDFDPDDIEMVFRVAASCAALGAPIRLNVFTRYPATPLAGHSHQQRYSPAKAQLMLDCPEVVCDNPLAESHPGLFPFHATEIPESDWRDRLALARFAQMFLQRYALDLLRFTDSPNNILFEEVKHLAKENPDLQEKAQPGWQDRTVGRYELY